MQVSCPGCRKVYKIDETQLPEKGRKMRCPKCLKVFTVTRPAPPAPEPDASLGKIEIPAPKAEDDFSDIRIPSLPPAGTPAAPTPKPGSSFFGNEEFDLDRDMKAPSLAPLPSLSDAKADFGAFDFGDPDVPSPAPASDAFHRDSVDLPSISAPSPALELDIGDDIERKSAPSLPAALGLPEASGADELPRISFGETPALQTIPPVVSDDEFGEIDFGPTVEKSAAVQLDDAEFDFPSGPSLPPKASVLDKESFGDIELMDALPSVPPASATPAAPPAPPKRPAAPPRPQPQDDSFLPEAPIRSLPPIGVVLDSYEAPFEGMPSPADLLDLADSPGAPSASHTTADLPLSPSSVSRAVGTGAMDYGEVDLSPGDTAAVPDLDAEEFDAFPVQAGGGGATPNDLDLAADPLSLRTEAVQIPESETEDAPEDARKRAVFEGRRRLERQSRRSKLLLLSLLAVAVIGGAALSFTSYGPFGANALFRLIPKPVDERAVAQTISAAQKKLLPDVPSTWATALRETEALYKEYPSSDDLRFFAAYLYFMHQVRFGVDTTLDKKASKALGVTGIGESESPYAKLAQTAQYLRYTRPLPKDPQVIEALKKTADGQVLLAEAALARGDAQGALTIAEKLDAQESSPRSGYLSARVLLRIGDSKHAAEAASRLAAVLKARPDHADAAVAVPAALLSQKHPDFEKVRAALEAADETLKKVSPTKAQLSAFHGLRARLAVMERSYPEAEKQIAQAEKLDPENLWTLLAKGAVRLVRRDYSGAASAYAEALAEAPQNVEAAVGKIEARFREGELAESKTALDALLPKHKDNARAHYLMGEIQAALKETGAAEKELKAALDLDDTLLEAYVSLSTLYLGLKRNDEAMSTLDKASETVPGSPLIKKTLAAGHAARGDWASAVIELDNALKIDSNDAESHFEMAVMYRKMGSYDDAKRALSEVEKRDPQYPGLALEQGLLMEETGDTASALSAYKKALSLKPEETGLKLRVGAASYLVGDYQTAEQLLKQVLAQQPASPEGNFYYGETLRVLNRAPEAVGFLTKACNLDRGNALYHLRLGMALDAVRDTDRAVTELETAVKLEPKNAEAYVAMGKIRLRLGSVRDAVEYLERGLSINPALSDGYLAAAQAYEQLSDNSSARKYYRKAAEVEPDNPEVHYRFGLAELQVNGKGASLAGFTKAVALAEKMDPKPQWFFEALYRRGVAERARGMRSQAIASFKRYLAEAPEKAIDRAEVVANLEDMGL